MSPRSAFSSEGAVVQVLLAGWLIARGSVLRISGTPRSRAAASQLQLPHGVTGKLQIDEMEHFVAIHKASLLCRVNLVFQLHTQRGYLCFTLPLVQLMSAARWGFPQTRCDIATLVAVTAWGP